MVLRRSEVGMVCVMSIRPVSSIREVFVVVVTEGRIWERAGVGYTSDGGGQI